MVKQELALSRATMHMCRLVSFFELYAEIYQKALIFHI